MTFTRRAGLAAAVVLVVAGCSGSATPSPAPTTAPTAASTALAPSVAPTVGPPEARTLKIGVDGLPDFGNVGIFKWVDLLKSQYGIDAQIVDLGSTAGPFRAMVSGNVDMLLGQIPSGVQLNIQSGSSVVKMIAAEDQATDYVLLSTPDITTLADLAGKKVGISEPGGGAESLTKAALKHENIDVTKIQFVSVGGTSARIAALLSGKVQAGAAHFPDAQDAIAKGGVKDLLDMAGPVGPYEFHTLWSTSAWLSTHPNLAQIAVNLFMDANRWEADNKAAYIALSQTNVTGLSDAIRNQTYDFFKQNNYFSVNGGMDAASIKSTVAVEQAVGNLPPTMPDLSTFADPSYVQNYLAANGTR